LKYRYFSLDGIRKDVCKKCMIDYQNTMPHKTMPEEKRIEILLKNRVRDNP